MTTSPVQAQPADLRKAERVLRLVWVIVSGAILFSMLTVTPLVQRVTTDAWDWTAPILPLVVDAAVIIVVRMDNEVSRLGAKPGGWATVLRWMTGLFTLGLNIGESALNGSWSGVAIHSVAPLLLIATSEAIPRYRRTITNGLERIAREQADERRRREQQREAREQRERDAREQEQRRREQAGREQREQQERAAREQREYDARMVREEREHLARLEQDKLDRIESSRRAEQERQDALERERIASQERIAQAQLADQRRREQQARDDKARRTAVREQAPAIVREHQDKPAKAVREHRPLHAVNTPVNTPQEPPVNTAKVTEAEALEAVRTAVAAGDYGVRALARETGWSTGWVSARVAELRDETTPAAAEASA